MGVGLHDLGLFMATELRFLDAPPGVDGLRAAGVRIAGGGPMLGLATLLILRESP